MILLRMNKVVRWIQLWPWKKRGRPKKVLTNDEIEKNKQIRKEKDNARKQINRDKIKQKDSNVQEKKTNNSKFNLISNSETGGENDSVENEQNSLVNSALTVKKKG